MFGIRAFAHVMHVRCSRRGRAGGGPAVRRVTGLLDRQRRRHTDVWRKSHVKGGRGGSGVSPAEGRLEPPAAGRGRKGPL